MDTHIQPSSAAHHVPKVSQALPCYQWFFFLSPLRGWRGEMEWLVRLNTFPINTWEKRRLQIEEVPGKKRRKPHRAE